MSVSALGPATSLIVAIATPFFLLGLGFAWVRLIAPSTASPLGLAVSFPLGSGLFTFLFFILSLLGVPITRASSVAVYLLLLVPAMGIAIFRTRAGATATGTEASRDGQSVGKRGWALLSMSLGPVLVLALFVAVMTAYSVWDAGAIWAAKGYGIAREGTIWAAELWGSHGLSYPFNVPLLIGAFELLAGDPVAISKAIFPLFMASMLLGMYASWGEEGVQDWLAALAALFLATIPLVFDQGTNGYANLPLAAYLLLGAVSVERGVSLGHPGELTLGGTLLGLASWTRVEGFVYAGAVLAAVLLVLALKRRLSNQVGYALLPFGIITAIWAIFYLRVGSTGSQAMGRYGTALQSWLGGDLGLYSLRLIFGYMRRYMFRTELWGAFFPAVIALGLVGIRRIVRDRRTSSQISLGMSALTGLVAVLLFYIGSFGHGDYLGWLTRSFPRALLPAALLFWYWIIMAIASPSPSPQSTQPAPAHGSLRKL